MSNIVTGEESRLYYYDVPSKSQNKVWIFEDEDVPVVVRKSRLVIVQHVVLDAQKDS